MICDAWRCLMKHYIIHTVWSKLIKSWLLAILHKFSTIFTLPFQCRMVACWVNPNMFDYEISIFHNNNNKRISIWKWETKAHIIFGIIGQWSSGWQNKNQNSKHKGQSTTPTIMWQIDGHQRHLICSDFWMCLPISLLFLLLLFQFFFYCSISFRLIIFDRFLSFSFGFLSCDCVSVFASHAKSLFCVRFYFRLWGRNQSNWHEEKTSEWNREEEKKMQLKSMRSIEVEANDVATHNVHNGIWMRNVSGISSRQEIHRQCCCLDFVDTTWYAVNLHRCRRRNETLITRCHKKWLFLRACFAFALLQTTFVAIRTWSKWNSKMLWVFLRPTQTRECHTSS